VYNNGDGTHNRSSCFVQVGIKPWPLEVRV
jgi:hypothetical protein